MTDDKAWKNEAVFYTKGNQNPIDVLEDVTDVVIVAHPDDAEIMAPDIIHACKNDPNRKIAVIVVTDGRGAPRDGGDGSYAHLTDDQLAAMREGEQVDAAIAGKYDFLMINKFPDVDDDSLKNAKGDLATELHRMLRQCPKLQNIVTHNPFDNHRHHRVVSAATTVALRMLPQETRQQIETFRGGEVWGEISFTEETDYILHIPLSKAEEIVQMTGLNEHRSQVIGAMDYPAAFQGRQGSRSILCNPLTANTSSQMMIAANLKPFIEDPNLTTEQYIDGAIEAQKARMLGRSVDVNPPTRVESAADARQAIEQDLTRSVHGQ